MPERPDQHRRAFVSITVGGRPLSDAVLLALSEVRVDQSLHVADAFTLRFNDHDLAILAGKSFDLGAEVDIGIDSQGVVTSLMTGEVTSLSAELDGLHQQQFVVTGLDRRHRLSRGVKVRTFTKSTDSDVVRKIAGEYGLGVSIDATSGRHEYLMQCGTDYEFIAERARNCGYRWWVAGRTLYFKKRESKHAARTVTWGSGLRRFRLRLSSTESAQQAVVRGWDPVSQKAVVGTSSMGGAQGAGVELATDAPLVTARVHSAQTFPAERFAWGTPVKDTHEATGLANSLAQRATAEQAVARGETLGDPELRPGVAVKVEGLAESLCGTYQLTRVEHVLTAGAPYLTRFESGGNDDHGLVDLLGGGRRPSAAVSPPLLGSSLVVGIVTNNTDPDKLGRAKVKYPSLTDTEESDWARVVSTGAGSSRGLQVIPDVGDEVLVGFEHGDVTRPLVLGGLWSSKNAHPDHATSGAKAGAIWKTKSGHLMTMSDGDSAEGYIRIALKTGKTVLRLGEDASSLEVERDLTVDGAGNVTIKARNQLNLEATNVTVKARAKLVLEGQGGVDVKSNGPANVSGVTVEVKGQGTASLEAAGMTQIKGGLVKIN